MGPRIVGPLVEKFLGSQSNNLVGRPCIFYPYNDFNVVASLVVDKEIDIYRLYRYYALARYDIELYEFYCPQ